MDAIATITKPWRDPIGYTELAFWFVIFIIVALALYDGVRVVGSYVKHSVTA